MRKHRVAQPRAAVPHCYAAFMTQTWDPALYQQKHAFVFERGGDVVELLAPKAFERILDLGCGTGQLTKRIADAGATVIGIDHSPQMIRQAKANFPELRFEVADARAFAFDEPFDAIFSNAVLHWVKPPERAVERISDGLKPAGRLVAEFGGKGNIDVVMRSLRAAAIEINCPELAAIEPWYYPSVGEYASLLERHGLEVTFATLFDRPTPLEAETGLRDWLRMFAGMFLEQVPDDRRDALIDGVEQLARPTLYGESGWSADYRRLRIVAVKRAY
jgi:trans-aconitate methyltransferase